LYEKLDVVEQEERQIGAERKRSARKHLKIYKVISLISFVSYIFFLTIKKKNRKKKQTEAQLTSRNSDKHKVRY